MSDFKRHIGRIKNTDRRCVVVFMQIPGKENCALIVDTDSLPDYLHESFFKIVESPEAQNSLNLADVLARKASPDSGYDMLNSLHLRNLLQVQHQTNIMMYPRPNAPVELTAIIDMVNKKEKNEEIKREDYNPSPSNRFSEKIESDNRDHQDGIAFSLLREADMLEVEANNKRERAYLHAPHLRPGFKPVDSKEIIEVKETVKPIIETIDDPSLDPEMKELLDMAQKHLDRANEREENSLKDIEETTQVKNPTEEKKNSRKRPRKAS